MVQPVGVALLDSLGLLNGKAAASAAWPDPKWSACTKSCVDKPRQEEISHAKRPYAIQPCQLECIPKDKPTAGVVLGINKVRETCWNVQPEDWVPETVVAVWLMQMTLLVLLGCSVIKIFMCLVLGHLCLRGAWEWNYSLLFSSWLFDLACSKVQ